MIIYIRLLYEVEKIKIIMQATVIMTRKSIDISKEKAKELVDIADQAFINFKGNSHHLEVAIGMLFMGRQIGWKPLLLMHDKKTVRRSEDILNVSFRELFDEKTINSDKSIAWTLVLKVTSFWKAVRGEIKGIRTNEFS